MAYFQFPHEPILCDQCWGVPWGSHTGPGSRARSMIYGPKDSWDLRPEEPALVLYKTLAEMNQRTNKSGETVGIFRTKEHHGGVISIGHGIFDTIGSIGNQLMLSFFPQCKGNLHRFYHQIPRNFKRLFRPSGPQLRVRSMLLP